MSSRVVSSLVSMMSISVNKIFSRIKNYLSDKIRAAFLKTDDDSELYYVYIPYPDVLPKNKRSKWTTNEKKRNAPFQSYDCYQFSSNQGAHFWYSETRFSGIPYTALIIPESSNTPVITTKNWTYFLTWDNGVLIECIQAERDAENSDEKDRYVGFKGWAAPAPLQHFNITPAKTAFAMMIVFSLFFAWQAGRVLSYQVAASSLSDDIASLNSQISEKLPELDKYKSRIDWINKKNNWEGEHGLPEIAIATVLKSLPAMEKVVVESIVWETKRITLEIIGEEVELASLVSVLENNVNTESAQVRPHQKANTWVIEAEFK